MDQPADRVSVYSFTGIYEQDSFWRDASLADAPSFYDLTGLSGTSGYLSDDTLPLLTEKIPSCAGLHFIDSGNTHYMSKLFTDRIDTPFALVLFDHHPDMQRPAFGDLLSCGSWLRAALTENPFLKEAWLLGVDPALAREVLEEDRIVWQDHGAVIPGLRHCLFSGRELYLLPEAGCLPELLPSLREAGTALFSAGLPLYLSVDKDVLSPDDVTTTWDQGTLSCSALYAAIEALLEACPLLGADICGECAPADGAAAIAQNDAINTKLLDIYRKHR